MSGRTSYEAGLAAEAITARAYEAAGMTVERKRWRGRAGEIDLVVRDRARVIFVEVKKARCFDRAAASLSRRQIGRIIAAGSEFLAGEPAGLDSDVRFDVALVNEVGALKILDNALAA